MEQTLTENFQNEVATVGLLVQEKCQVLMQVQ